MAGTWSSGGNLNTARLFLAGGGSPSQAICMGGSLSVFDNSDATETYNGTVWGSAANLNTARRLLAGGGNSSNAICFGGYVSAASNVTEHFNGTSWSSGGNLGTARNGLGGVGNTSDALSFGGVNPGWLSTTERYNGTSWSSGGALSGSKGYMGSAGIPSAALCLGGQNSGGNTTVCELYNGTSWAAAGSFGTAKRLMAGLGISSSAFAVSGYTSTYITNVDKYNGSSWAADTAINTARQGLAGGGTTTSAICMGGYTGSSSAVTEVYSDGSGEVVRNAASSRNTATGRLNRIALTAWNLTELSITTYDGSGQAVHPSVIHIPGGWGGYKYFMAMTPYPGGNDDYENPSLLASNDGETWVVPTGITNPLEPQPATHNCDPCLVWDGDSEILYMYYNRESTTKRIPITQSGGTFSAGEQDTLTLPETAMSIAIKRNSASDWVCWFRSVLYSGPSKFYRCVSTNGVTWTDQTEIPIVSQTTCLKVDIPEIWHQSVYELPDGRNLWLLTMYPNGIASGGYVDLYWGIQQSDYHEIRLNPTALVTSIATWGTGHIYLSSVMQLENGMYRLYISASTTSTHWSIGYADIALW